MTPDNAQQRAIICYAAILTLISTTVREARCAEANWDVAPYDIRVWVAYEPVPELVDAWQARIPQDIMRRAELCCGSAWQTTVTTCPTSLRQPMLGNLQAITAGHIRQIDEPSLAADKLFLAAIRVDAGGYLLQVREIDCRTEFRGPIVVRNVSQPRRLGTVVAQSILDAFAPIGLIARVRDKQVRVRMRAGLLSVQDDSPTTLADGGVLRPVLRKVDRLGKPLPGAIESVPWTLFRVTGRQAGTLNCELISGLRSPLRTRSSRRIERFAVAVKPYYESTQLRLHALNDPENNLSGYDIYSRLPGDKTSTFVGRSDWQGFVTVTKDDDPIKLLYVKNGGRLLARLPIVPGYQETMDAALTDDSVRLEAEGFLKGLQEEIVDLVARRKVLSMRFELRMEDDKLGDAEQLLDEMRSLATRDELTRRLRDRRQALTSENRSVQDKIDRMFRQTRDILNKHLDPAEIEELRAVLAAARRTAVSSKEGS